MEAKARILAIWLMESLRKDPAYGQLLGLEVRMKRAAYLRRDHTSASHGEWPPLLPNTGAEP